MIGLIVACIVGFTIGGPFGLVLGLIIFFLIDK